MGTVLVSGLVSGMLYALLGVALSLVYRTGGVLNLAVGPLAFLAVFVAVLEIPGGGDHALWALLAAALLGAVLSGLMYVLIVRPVEGHGSFSASIATLGVALAASAAIAWRWGSQVHAPPRLGLATRVQLAGTTVSPQQIAVALVTLVLLGLVSAGLRFTRLGVAVRSVGQGPLTASMLGLPVTRIRVVAWAVGGLLAAVAAFLSVGRTGLIAGSENALLVAALAGLVVGGFDSLVGVAVGGLLLGVLQNLLAYWVASWLQSVALLIVVVAVLMVRPNGLIGRHPGRLAEPELPQRGWLRVVDELPRAKARTAAVGLVAGVAVAVWAARAGSFETVSAVQTAVPLAIVILGMYVVIGLSGQLVLGQGAFAAVGAYAAGVLAEHSGAGMEISLPLGFVCGAVLGAIVGLPCSRLGTVYLSVVTLVVASAVGELALHLDITGGANGLVLPQPRLFGRDLTTTSDVIAMQLAVLVVLVVLVALLRRSPLGLDLIAGRDAPRAARTSGARVQAQRVSAFSISGGITAIGGIFYAQTAGVVSPDLFGLDLSLKLLAAQVLGGVDSILGALTGGAFLGAVPEATSGLQQLPDIVYGAAVIAVLLLAPRGLAPLFGSLVERAVHALGSPRQSAADGTPRTDGVLRADDVPGTDGRAGASDSSRAAGAAGDVR